jgi:hypothetical protein
MSKYTKAPKSFYTSLLGRKCCIGSHHKERKENVQDELSFNFLVSMFTQELKGVLYPTLTVVACLISFLLLSTETECVIMW